MKSVECIIEKGVIGLANAGVLNGGNWFVGHFGAEMLALAFILVDKQIDSDAEPLVYERIEQCLKLHAPFFETPLPQYKSENDLNFDDLYQATKSSISDFYVDGHHTIYAALALRAFSLFPNLVCPEIVAGIIALLKTCEAAGFDRFYQLDHAAFQDKKFTQPFTFSSAKQAAQVALSQHSRVITDGEAEGEFYFFSGSRLHLVTHAQALLELEQLGFSDLVTVGLPTLTKHCICVSASAEPKDAEPYEVKKVLDPRRLEFWQREKQNPHQAKLAYAVLSMLSVLTEEEVTKYFENLTAYWEFYE